MTNDQLTQAIGNFTSVAQSMTEYDLNRPWDWKGYEEGLRFIFFRTYEGLQELAARLESARASRDRPLSTAQRILAQFHAAYLDLQAILLGVTGEQFEQPPAQGEWPVREALAHIVQADRGFFASLCYGLERLRTGDGRPEEMSEEYWNAFWAGQFFKDISEEGTPAEIQAYHQALHARILGDFQDITDAELGSPIRYWEGEPMTVEFRLHRFDSHMRQHTIQIEKTLAAIGAAPGEAKILLRMIYRALAGVEGGLLGEDGIGLDQRNSLAAEINSWTDEMRSLLAKS